MSFYEVNNKSESEFPIGYRYYDEGVKAAQDNVPYNKEASLSWKDGWRDYKEATKT